MTDLLIYGASDDLIEFDGVLVEEANPVYNKPAAVSVWVDDAQYASLVIEYDPDNTGEWRITKHSSNVRVIPARGEDEERDENGCPGYSDKAVIDMGTIEARRIDLHVDEVD